MIQVIPNWHPIFVHFTIALVTTSALCYLISYFRLRATIKKELLIVARWCLWFGTVAAIITVIAGFFAYYTVVHDTVSHLAMAKHRNWALLTLSVILCMGIWSVWAYRKNKSISLMFVLMMLVVFILLMTTAWHGAEVVYRHGVGVMSLPKTTGAGHKHNNNKKTKHNTHKHF